MRHIASSVANLKKKKDHLRTTFKTTISTNRPAGGGEGLDITEFDFYICFAVPNLKLFMVPVKNGGSKF